MSIYIIKKDYMIDYFYLLFKNWNRVICFYLDDNLLFNNSTYFDAWSNLVNYYTFSIYYYY
jgi:hypothetical protein